MGNHSIIKVNEGKARLYTHCNLASPVLIMAVVGAANVRLVQ